MNFNYYLEVWKKFADFSSRSRRKEFWFFMLINMAINYVLSFLIGPLGLIGTIIMFLFSLAILVPSLAVGARRMHDIGKSGWWMLVNLIPFVGTIWFIVLAVKDSEPGSNKWGACPK